MGAGNYNDREVDAAINLPIVDGTLLTRLVFNGQKRDGFTWVQSTPDHPNGIDADNRGYWSVRGSVTFRPTDRFENDTIATYQHFDTNGTAAILIDANPAIANLLAGLEGIIFGNVGFSTLPSLLAQQQALGTRTHIPLNTPIESGGTMLAVSNVTTVQMGDDFKLRTILGYDRVVTKRVFDIDGTPLPIIDEPRLPSTYLQRQYTAETQLLGKSFGGRVDWIAGGFALNSPLRGLRAKTRKAIRVRK